MIYVLPTFGVELNLLTKKNTKTQLKLFRILMMLAVAAFIATSCSDDEPEVDTAAPAIELTAPETGDGFAFGGELIVTGTVSDDQGLSTITITLTADGESSPAVTETITEFDSNVLHELNTTLTVPEAVGNYVLNVSAADATGNESMENASVIVGVQLLVTVPENTPETDNVHVVGSFNEWVPEDTNYILTRGEDGIYTITLINFVKDDTQFKFARGSWDKVEKDENCEEVANRIYDGSSEIEIAIAKWVDLDQCDG